jgi:transcriptional regulator with XRE-family HTH domain
MSITLGRMTLPELLERYRVYTIRELSRRTGLSRQQAWNLWHGRARLGRRNLERLHTALEIPFDELLQVAPPPPRKKEAPSPEAPRPERFGWADGEVGYYPATPEEAQDG